MYILSAISTKIHQANLVSIVLHCYDHNYHIHMNFTQTFFWKEQDFIWLKKNCNVPPQLEYFSLRYNYDNRIWFLVSNSK